MKYLLILLIIAGCASPKKEPPKEKEYPYYSVDGDTLFINPAGQTTPHGYNVDERDTLYILTPGQSGIPASDTTSLKPIQ